MNNMQFILGLLSGVVFLFALGVVFLWAYQLGKKQRTNPPAAAADDEKTREAAQLHEDFVKLMNYNESIALQRKKVD